MKNNDLEKCLIHNVLYSFPTEIKTLSKIKMLYESKSVPDITDECVRIICQYVIDGIGKQLFKPVENDTDKRIVTYEIHIPSKICQYVENVFFNEIDCTIRLMVCNGERWWNLFKNMATDSGIYDNVISNEQIEVNNANNKLVLKNITIKIQCFADVKNIFNKVYAVLIHEFNHAYEDYCRIVNKKESYKDWLKNSRYNLLINTMRQNDNGLELIYLAQLLYHLSPTEVNAKVSQIYGELKNKHFNNSFEATDAIKKTQAYMVLETTNEVLNILNDISDITIQSKLLQFFNKVSIKKCNNFNEMMDKITNEMNIVVKRIFNRAAKALTRW